MTRRRLSWGAYLAIVSFLLVSGCGDTNENRRRISQQAKALAAQVKAAPNSAAGKAAMSELIDILNGTWSFGRCQAAYALKSLGPLAAPALPDLMRAANCGDVFVESAALGAIRNMGPAASPAVDILIGKLEYALTDASSSSFSAVNAAEALGNIGEPALKAMPVLEHATKSKDKFLAEAAQQSLNTLKQIADAQ